jgi:hypothetical protein
MSFQNPFFDALDNCIDNPIGRGGQAETHEIIPCPFRFELMK